MANRKIDKDPTASPARPASVLRSSLKQVACTELGAHWDVVDVVLHATDMPRVKVKVGSESAMLFSEPLAQACAALRDALAAGQIAGQVRVTPVLLSSCAAFAPLA